MTKIEASAFNNCSKLIYLIFESGSVLETIGNSAFSPSTKLTSIIIPTSVTSIESSAFASCTNLTSLSFESGSILETIGNAAFTQCYKLTSIIIPDNTTNIGWNSFQECILLNSLTIGANVDIIGNYAFDGCTALTEIVIPASATSIGATAFQDCSNLKTVYFLKDSAMTASSDIGTDAFQSSGLATVYADSQLISNMTWSTTSTNTIGGKGGVTVVGTVVIEGNGNEIFTAASWTGAGSPLAFMIGPGFTSVAVNALRGENANKFITDIIIGKWREEYRFQCFHRDNKLDLFII